MGEHWVNPEIVAKGVFDAARPGLLTYARVNGVPALTGVVYALPLEDNEKPPDFPFDRSHWHDHVGTVDDESLLLNHDVVHRPIGGLRLAVLHAWIWVDNPDGTFVTDNWALPATRLGLRVDRAPPFATARALALISGELPYFLSLAEGLGQPSEAELAYVRQVLGRHTFDMRAWWESRRLGAPGVVPDRATGVVPLSVAEQALLAGMWDSAWAEIERGMSAKTGARLRRIWRP